MSCKVHNFQPCYCRIDGEPLDALQILTRDRDEWKRRWSEENDAMIAAQEECDVWEMRAEEWKRRALEAEQELDIALRNLDESMVRAELAESRIAGVCAALDIGVEDECAVMAVRQALSGISEEQFNEWRRLDARAWKRRALEAEAGIDRLRVIVDEALGIQPVMNAEELLTVLERHLHGVRRQPTEAETIARVVAWLTPQIVAYGEEPRLADIADAIERGEWKEKER